MAVDQIFVNADFIYGTTGSDLWRRPLIGGQTAQFAIPSASSGTIVGVGGDDDEPARHRRRQRHLPDAVCNRCRQTPHGHCSARRLPELHHRFDGGITHISDGNSGGYYMTYDDDRLTSLTVGSMTWGTSDLDAQIGTVDSLVDTTGWIDGGDVYFAVLDQNDATLWGRTTGSTTWGSYAFPSSVSDPRGVARHGNYFYVSHGTQVTRHAVADLVFPVDTWTTLESSWYTEDTSTSSGGQRCQQSVPSELCIQGKPVMQQAGRPTQATRFDGISASDGVLSCRSFSVRRIGSVISGSDACLRTYNAWARI